MSYRLLYTAQAQRHITKAPAALATCIRYHLGEMERSESLPGQRITFPHLDGMGYFFQCRDASDGTLYQLVARYVVGSDEVELHLLGLACYPLLEADPEDQAL